MPQVLLPEKISGVFTMNQYLEDFLTGFMTGFIMTSIVLWLPKIIGMVVG